MQRTIKLGLLLSLPAGGLATKCKAGYKHHGDLTKKFCDTDAEDADSCNDNCCTVDKETCGGSGVTCSFGTYTPGGDVWASTKTSDKTAQQQTDCCHKSVTCDNTLYTCPAGFKKTSGGATAVDGQIGAPKNQACTGGPKSCSTVTSGTVCDVKGVCAKTPTKAKSCCVADIKTCGGYYYDQDTRRVEGTNGGAQGTPTCPAGQTFPAAPDKDDAWSSKKIADWVVGTDTYKDDAAGQNTHEKWQATCCTAKKTCSSVKCETGFVAQVTGAWVKGTQVIAAKGLERSVVGEGDIIEKALEADKYNAKACCVYDDSVKTCGTIGGIACPAGTYQPTGSSWTSVITKDATKNSQCCTAKATCAVADCGAGNKKKKNVDKQQCSGDHTTCTTGSLCCEVDKNTCGGLQATTGIACPYGFFDESDTWILFGDKKTPEATMDAWKKRNASEATKNTACCTARAPCKLEVGTTTPAAAVATTTPAAVVTTTPSAPALKYSENKVDVEDQAQPLSANLVPLGVGCLMGMAVLMVVQNIRSRRQPSPTRVVARLMTDDCPE